MDKLTFLSSSRVKDYLFEQLDKDPMGVILNPPGVWKKQAKLLADQLISRKKAKDKLPSWYSNTKVILPPPLSMEQSSSEEAAGYKGSLISGDHLIDLTGGMGVDCLAISSNFDKVSYVEQDTWLCELFTHNHQEFTKKKIEVINKTAESYLEGSEGNTTYFIDPARRDSEKQKVFRFEDCIPNINDLMPHFIKNAKQVLVKASPLMDISQGIRELGYVAEVHVLSIRNECKEVLFLMDFEKGEIEDPVIHCVNITPIGQQHFRFTLHEEKSSIASYGSLSNFLYDPNASILKAGAFKSIMHDYPIQKLSSNTHLYTSDEYLDNFPGRCFQVVDPNPSKTSLKALNKANVITKNYPLKPEQIKKQYRIKDGGELFLIGFKDQQDKPQLIIAKQA